MFQTSESMIRRLELMLTTASSQFQTEILMFPTADVAVQKSANLRERRGAWIGEESGEQDFAVAHTGEAVLNAKMVAFERNCRGVPIEQTSAARHTVGLGVVRLARPDRELKKVIASLAGIISCACVHRVHKTEPCRVDRQPDLLCGLAHQRFCRHLSRFDVASRQSPVAIEVARVATQAQKNFVAFT